MELLLFAGIGVQVKSPIGIRSYTVEKTISNVDYINLLGNVVLFDENFEDGNAVGWSFFDGNGDGITFAVSGCINIHQPPPDCGSYALNYDDDLAGDGAPPSFEMAITPAIDLTTVPTANSFFLSFDYGFDSYSQDDTVRVYVASYNGTGWTDTSLIMEQPVSSIGDSGFVSFDITGLVYGAESLVIIFTYVDAGGWNWNVAFDNINISAYIPDSNDLQIVDIIPPAFDFYTFYPVGNAPIWPRVGDVGIVVANPGTNDQLSFDLVVEVNGVPYTLENLSLLSQTVDTVFLSGVDVDSISTFVVYHSLSPDDNPANDTLIKRVDFITYKVVSDTITYSDVLDPIIAIGSSDNLGSVRIAVKFDSSDLYLFRGKYIKAIFFYHCIPGSFCNNTGNNAVAIYPDIGGMPDHTNALFRKVIGDVGTVPGIVFSRIDSISYAALDALTIGNDFPFYIARELEIVDSSYPLAADFGCTAGKGCWISADSILGGSWVELTTLGLDYNWILGIVVGDTADYVVGDESIIVSNDSKLIRGIINGYLLLGAPAEENMTIEIYNASGRLVRKVMVPKGSKRVFVGELPVGAYFYINDRGKAGALIVK